MTYKFPPYLTKLIKSYLHNRTFQVHLLNAVSTTRPIGAGVPQGSILGPTLFNIYINDIPKTPLTDLALYADDTAIIAQSMTACRASALLQEALNNLEDWYEDWRIKINVTKSNAVLFTKKKKQSAKGRVQYNQTLSISLFDENIPWSKDAKYLGVHFDTKLSWNKHVSTIATRATQRLGILKPLLNRRSKLSLANGITIFKTMILPIMTYAAHVWATTSKTNMQKLQRVQNKALRTVAHCPWYIRNTDLHKDLDISTFQKTVRKLAKKFYSELESNSNILIKELATYDAAEMLKHKRPKNLLK
jgi:hypothetical protein